MLLRTKLHGKSYRPRMGSRIREYGYVHSYIRVPSWMATTELETVKIWQENSSFIVYPISFVDPCVLRG